MDEPIGTAEFSSLCGELYDCILRRDLWEVFLDRLCALTGGCAASLNVHALPTQEPELIVERGTDPAYSASYVRTYARINPLFEASLLYHPAGEVRTLYDAVDLADYHRTRFYREWVAPQGWGDWLGAMLIRSQSRLSLLAIARKEQDGPYGRQQVELVRLLMPHLQRAILLGRLLDDHSIERSGLAAVVSRMKIAALLVEPSGRIAHANPPGEAMIAEGAILRERAGTLSPADTEVRRQLSLVLAGASGGEPMLSAVDGAAGRRLVYMIPPSRESGGLAIVLVTVPEPDLPLPGRVLAEAFGLTPGELRVLIPFLGGRTLAEIADDIGVTRRTVKAHLQKLFEKTGTTRQPELMREVMRLVPPIALF